MKTVNKMARSLLCAGALAACFAEAAQAACPSLAGSRTRFARELNDAAIRARLNNLICREVGGQGTVAQQAFTESLFNRAAARGQTLDRAMRRGYFPAVSLRAGCGGLYDGIIRQVIRGSNVSAFATGNASGTVGFGGGPETFAANGERFGIENHDADRRFAERHRRQCRAAPG